MQAVLQDPAELPSVEMSSRWPAESVARALAPATKRGSYLSARENVRRGELGIGAPWLPRPETRSDIERREGPGLEDLKLVTFELPDFKDLGGR